MEELYPGLMEKDKGIAHTGGIVFHTAGDFAKENLYYVHFGAQSVCIPPYRINRAFINCFVLFLIDKGALEFEYGGKRFRAVTGAAVLLDGKQSQHYWAEQETHLRWLHFSGCSTQAYYDRLAKHRGNLFPGMAPILDGTMKSILSAVRSRKPSDDRISTDIHKMLAALAILSERQTTHKAVSAAKEIIDAEYMTALDVEQIAVRTATSRFYLSRLFQAEMGCGIHAYLLQVRLNHAKSLLAEGNESIGEVAQRCGFASSTHFIRAFKKDMQITPNQFRLMF